MTWREHLGYLGENLRAARKALDDARIEYDTLAGMAMAAPSWWTSVAREFEQRGVPVPYWLGVALAEGRGRFNPFAVNNSGTEYSVGAWQYNFMGGRGQEWMQSQQWTREQAELIFSNPASAAPYVARDLAGAYTQSGGDPDQFMRLSGHPGANATSDNALLTYFREHYREIPTDPEAAWNWLEANGNVVKSRYTRGNVNPDGTTTNDLANGGILGQIGQNIRQGIGGAVADIQHQTLDVAAQWWQESWPSLLLGGIAVLLIIAALFTWGMQAVNSPAGRTAIRVAASA